ncbi:uncharacterized protein LJ206_013283 [Theristicus caerulescens]
MDKSTGQPGHSISSKQEMAFPASPAHKGTRFVPPTAALVPAGSGRRNLTITLLLRQRLRHGDLCLCGLKARLLQCTPQNHLQAGAAREEKHDCSRTLSWGSWRTLCLANRISKSLSEQKRGNSSWQKDRAAGAAKRQTPFPGRAVAREDVCAKEGDVAGRKQRSKHCHKLCRSLPWPPWRARASSAAAIATSSPGRLRACTS